MAKIKVSNGYWIIDDYSQLLTCQVAETKEEEKYRKHNFDLNSKAMAQLDEYLANNPNVVPVWIDEKYWYEGSICYLRIRWGIHGHCRFVPEKMNNA